MKADTITGAMGTLEETGFTGKQRMAMVKAIAEMQRPLFDAIEHLGSRIEKLEAKVDDRFEKLESKITGLEVEVAIRDVRLARREIGLIITGITLALAILGGLVQLRAFMQPLISAL